MKNTTGWVKLHRQLFDNKIWFLEPFTRGQAWIDLFANANHKESSFFVRGNEVKLKRGQTGWSEITMAKRWTWSRNKVRRFLKWLEMEQQIEQQKLFKLTTIITIRNYDKYQNDTTDDTTERQQKDNRRYTNKNDKNVKNVNNIYSSQKSIGEKEFTLIAEKYKVTPSFVCVIYDRLVNYCQANGKSYKNYYRALMNFVSREKEKKLENLQKGKINDKYRPIFFKK